MAGRSIRSSDMDRCRREDEGEREGRRGGRNRERERKEEWEVRWRMRVSSRRDPTAENRSAIDGSCVGAVDGGLNGWATAAAAGARARTAPRPCLHGLQVARSLKDYNSQIEQLKQGMDDATCGADSMRSDIGALARRYPVIDREEQCGCGVSLIQYLSLHAASSPRPWICR